MVIGSIASLFPMMIAPALDVSHLAHHIIVTCQVSKQATAHGISNLQAVATATASGIIVKNKIGNARQNWLRMVDFPSRAKEAMVV